ncbi:MAG: hypothetical protein QOI83_4079, partial [Streptomycetaceae bacterium]|nr:hypothetical protein [Streptomycetaceae bacterium]
MDSYHIEVMGDVLGQARLKHIRAAVKQLHGEGKTARDGKGDVPALRTTRQEQTDSAAALVRAVPCWSSRS